MPPFPFQPTPFQPHPLLRNEHMQTVGGRYLRREGGIQYRRVRLDTPDGDFVDVDFADVPGHTWSQIGDDAPILYVLHGLEGSARAAYAATLYRKAAAAGLRPVGINYRSCSGEMNRTNRLYHMGATDDVALVHDWLEARFPAVPKGIIGFSLGGNIMLKYLGEQGEALQSRFFGAVAISPPMIATGKQAINHGVGALYGAYILRSLRGKVRQKAHELRGSKADLYGALTARTLLEFDEAFTAPIHDFADAQDYYARSNSVRFLPDVRVPALLIRAQDDPFFYNNIPHEIIKANPFLYPAFPDHGGHVGFVKGVPPYHNNWAQEEAIRFLQTAFTHR